MVLILILTVPIGLSLLALWYYTCPDKGWPYLLIPAFCLLALVIGGNLAQMHYGNELEKSTAKFSYEIKFNEKTLYANEIVKENSCISLNEYWIRNNFPWYKLDHFTNDLTICGFEMKHIPE